MNENENKEELLEEETPEVTEETTAPEETPVEDDETAKLKKELADKIAADKAIANSVEDQITALPAVDKLVLADKAAVEAARAAYDALTDEQIAYMNQVD